MTVQERRISYLAFLLVVSAFGLVISASLLGNLPSYPATFGERMDIVALAYASVCVAGALAVIFPVACSRVLGIRWSRASAIESADTRTTRILGILFIHGHHQPGVNAKDHEIRVRGKSFCATCYGLLAGAVLSLAVVTVYALSGMLWTDTRVAYALYYSGVAGVILGLIQPIALDPRAWLRFLFAMVFVVGTGFMLIATDILTANLIGDLFVLLLAVFWLLSRISSSHRSQCLRGSQASSI